VLTEVSLAPPKSPIFVDVELDPDRPPDPDGVPPELPDWLVVSPVFAASEPQPEMRMTESQTDTVLFMKYLR
jgi:hypothetical protein